MSDQTADIVAALAWIAEYNHEVLGGNEEMARTIYRLRAALDSLEARLAAAERERDEWMVKWNADANKRMAAEARLRQAEQALRAAATYKSQRVEAFMLGSRMAEGFEARVEAITEAFVELAAKYGYAGTSDNANVARSIRDVLARAALDAQPAERSVKPANPPDNPSNRGRPDQRSRREA